MADEYTYWQPDVDDTSPIPAPAGEEPPPPPPTPAPPGRPASSPRTWLWGAFVFDQIQIGDRSMTPPTTPPAPKHDGPEVLAPMDVPSSERAPSHLAAGYRRLGAYQQGGVVQLLYSDGLYDLSLFQQQGGLDAGDLPTQRRAIRFEGRQAWEFSWPGGEGLVWTAGRTVYTLVGDVPPDELTAVASSVPVHRSTSVGHRLRQACRSVVESFTGGL